MKLLTQVNRSDEYAQIVAKRPLSTREQLLKQIVLRIAEENISRERIKHTETKGNLNMAEQQTKFALFAGSTGQALGSGINFLFTPFAEMPELYFGKNHPKKELEQAVQTNRDSASTNEISTSGKCDVAHDSSAKKNDSKLEMFIAGLPKWIQACLLFTKDRLTGLSPMTTAVLFVLGISVAIMHGEYSRTNLENSYKLAQDDIKKYKADAEKLPQIEAQLEKLNTDYKSLQISQLGIEDQSSELRQTLSEKTQQLKQLEEKHLAEIDSLREAHKSELTNLRGALEEETLKKITKLEQDNLQLENDLKKQREEANDNYKSLQDTKRDLGIAQSTISQKIELIESLRTDTTSKDKRIRELAQYEDNFIRLSSFTRDVLGLVKDNLINSSTRYITNNRTEFKEKYRLLYGQSEELFEFTGLRKF